MFKSNHGNRPDEAVKHACIILPYNHAHSHTSERTLAYSETLHVLLQSYLDAQYAVNGNLPCILSLD